MPARASSRTPRRRRAAAARPKKKGVRSIYVDDALWRLAKIEGATTDKTVSEIIREELRGRYAKQIRELDAEPSAANGGRG